MVSYKRTETQHGAIFVSFIFELPSMHRWIRSSTYSNIGDDVIHG